MKVIVVRVGNSKAYPPTINLINALCDLDYKVILCTTRDSEGVEESLPVNTIIDYIDYNYGKTSLAQRMKNYLWIKKQLFKSINKYYDHNTVVWVEDDTTIKHLAYEITKYRYILRLDELNETLYATQHFRSKYLSLNATKIGNKALAIVVPEYNRAQITKVWWNLEKLPFVLPNKPYKSMTHHSEVALCKQTISALDSISNKKIVLYQGKINAERPIEPFIQAVEDMDDFVFVVNSSNVGELKQKYKKCILIDYIAPPFHLQVTQRAYIGVVAYIPGIGTDSTLNALYCAPNKIFEYGTFGIPFISNDLPPLRSLYDKYGCGLAADITKISDIKEKIVMIDQNYSNYSQNVKRMNDSVDFKGIVEELFNIIENKIKTL